MVVVRVSFTNAILFYLLMVYCSCLIYLQVKSITCITGTLEHAIDSYSIIFYKAMMREIDVYDASAGKHAVWIEQEGRP